MQKLIVVALVFLVSCSSNKNNNEPYKETRETINPEAIKTYSEDVKDELNPEWKFTVQLFEQRKSLNYEVKFQYKEVTGEKIFTVPNLGFMPKPDIKKGPQPFSCIIGFYDADSTFMEYRMVLVENENLVYRHLKEYQVDAKD
jgi:hypothetical protein